MDKYIVGNELRRIREFNDLSAKEMAELLNVDVERLRKWEQKGLKPRKEDQNNIEKALGINISELDKIEKLNFNSKNVPTANMKAYSVKDDVSVIGNLSGGQIEMTKSGNEFVDIGGGQFVMIIPLVEEYAQAGYTSGFGDKEYIDELPKHSIIVSQKHKGIYRAFRVKGESMDDNSTRAICDGDVATGREIEKIHWNSRFHLHKFTDYIIVHKEGIVLKTIIKHDVEKGIIICQSRNPDKTSYPDFEIKLSEVSQILNVVNIDRPWR